MTSETDHSGAKKGPWKNLSGIIAGVQAFATLALVVILLFAGWNMYSAKQRVSSATSSIMSGENLEEQVAASATKAKEFLDEHNATERAKAGLKSGASKVGQKFLEKIPGVAEKINKKAGREVVTAEELDAAIKGVAETKGAPIRERLAAGWTKMREGRAAKEQQADSDKLEDVQSHYFEMYTPE